VYNGHATPRAYAQFHRMLMQMREKNLIPAYFTGEQIDLDM
jgi:hypothetical protein